jgi:hypothetical protein
MKTLITLLTASLILTACANNSNRTKETTTTGSDTVTSNSSTHMDNTKTGSVDDVIGSYLEVKNALTKDDGKEAAAAANNISTNLAKVNETAFTSEQKKIYDDVKDDIQEHVQHISSNASKIDHQREHFDLLSQDMIDLLKATGTSKMLYMDFCPMYNNKKGAYWLSETRDIKNPYYGKEMLECGEMKEEIKPKV